MTGNSLDPAQIEVEAEFYFIQDSGSPSLSSKQLQLAEVMTRRGYDVLHKGQRVWEYILQNRQPSPGYWWRLKQKIGLVNEAERKNRQSMENLRGTRNDHPYRIKFRFIPTSWDNGDEGYIVEVECVSRETVTAPSADPPIPTVRTYSASVSGSTARRISPASVRSGRESAV